MDGGDREVGPMSLSEVSNILWRERQLLELLVFKLEEEQLVLASGRTRWLSHATREVETILEEIKRVELERAMAVAGSAGELGMSDTPSLRELTAIAPTPWDGIFAEHRRALLALAQEIDAITKSNRDMLQRGQQAAREALASLGEIDIDSYDSSGTMPDRSLALRLVDKAI
jgi:transposase